MKNYYLMDIFEHEALEAYRKIDNAKISTHNCTLDANVFLVKENLNFSYKEIPTEKPSWLIIVNWHFFKRFQDKDAAVVCFENIDKNSTNKNLVDWSFKTREQMTDDSV